MEKEIIRLSIPAKPEYLMMARLVVSVVFDKAGFHVDDIEDAKTALSEACLLLMPKPEQKAEFILEIWAENGVHASITTTAKPEGANTAEREFSLFMLEALIDEAVLEEKENSTTYKLFKAVPE